MYCHTSISVQLLIGKMRKCSPKSIRPLNRFHNSGRWFFGSHWPNESRWEKKRSFARAFSSSRRAPPRQASNLCCSMALSSAGICRRLRLGFGPVSSLARPASISACTLPIINSAPTSLAKRSRNTIVSPKLCPVSTCTSGNGSLDGQKAFCAKRTITMESLPPENNNAGLPNCAATSRMMKMDSASSCSKWVS